MIKVKSFKKLKGNSKKYEIIFEKNGKTYTRKFGAAGMSDYTIHKDKERRERYISRHKKDLRTGDPMRAGYLSMYILWNKPTLKASLADYKRRLGVYNRTGKFPKSISGSKKMSFGMKNIAEMKDILADKVRWDPAQIILEYTATPELQKLARGYLSRKFVKSKKYLKMVLLAINIDHYRRLRVANPEQRAMQEMDSGSPWLRLHPKRYETAFFLRQCSRILTRSDRSDLLWYNCMFTVLVKISEFDPEYRRYPENISDNLNSCVDSIINLLPELTDPQVWPDLDHSRWYRRALDEIEENEDHEVNEDAYQFGKKTTGSKIPDNVVNKKMYSNVKAKIKRSIKGRRWGAYDSGRLVREYKAKGGKYTGSKGKTNLSRWYKEKWVDACAWPKRKSCGRKTGKSIAYCRPSKKVDSKTPKLVQKLTAAQRKSRCARKKKSPMKRITKFGYTTPDISVGNGWVIHCNHVQGIGPHATLRQKLLAGPKREDDWAFRYGIKTRGQSPEFWAAGDDPLGPKSGSGLPSVRGQQLLMNYFYDNCGGYNPRQLPPKSPAHYSYNKFGDKKKIKQDMYNDIFLGPNKDLIDNVRSALIKRCPNADSPRIINLVCEKRVVELMISIYETMVKNGDIELNTSRKKTLNKELRKIYKDYDPPSMLNLRKKYLITEFLTGVQGGYYGPPKLGKLANDILESIIT